MEKPDYFEQFIKSEFLHLTKEIKDLKDDTEKILTQTTITNGRVRELERWRASSQGHWGGVNKTIAVILIIVSGLGVLIGWAVNSATTMLWH